MDYTVIKKLGEMVKDVHDAVTGNAELLIILIVLSVFDLILNIFRCVGF